MAGLSLDNAFYLLIAIAGLWFMARFVIAPKRGAPGLRAMLGREKPVRLEGLGREAIATLIGDACGLVVDDARLRGLILAGPFAVQAAGPASSVILVALTDDIDLYSGTDWLSRWAYPGRGHAILTHDIERHANGVAHRLTLRGSPPIEIHFVRLDCLHASPALRPAFAEGTQTIDDPSGLVEKLRQRWAEEARKSG